MQQETINLTLFANTFGCFQRVKEKYKKYDPKVPTDEDINNDFWCSEYSNILEGLCNILPSGSGLDSGCAFDYDNSKETKLIFTTSFHHIMNDNGYYDGWTDHKIIITPKFGGYDMHITGRDRNFIKDYLYQLFDSYFCCNTYAEMIEERKKEHAEKQK